MNQPLFPGWKAMAGLCGAAMLAGCLPAPVDKSTNGRTPADSPITGSGGSAAVDPAIEPPRTAIGGATGAVSVGPPRGGPSPAFLNEAAITRTEQVPAISGGTLLVLADGVTAFAADPDRDTLSFANLRDERLLTTLTLQPGDEPGRSVEDSRGAVHVVLRRAGAVLSVNADRTIRERRVVCTAPRGIALDAANDRLFVACAGGELVSLGASGGAAARTAWLDRDLRDVVVSGNKLFVSTFRSAELFVLSAQDGSVIDRRRAPGSGISSRVTIMTPNGPMPGASPGVAWRLRARPTGGGVAMIHQEASNGELGTEGGGYANGPCKSAMGAAVTNFAEVGAPTSTGQMAFAILPVDFAYSRSGRVIGAVMAGNANSQGGVGGQIQFSLAPDAPAAPTPGTADPTPGAIAPPPNAPSPPPGGDCLFPTPPPEEIVEFRQPTGEATAIDFDGQGRVIVQTREPARIEILSHRGGSIKLSNDSRFDSGHAVFHVATQFGLSCASCHPEGGDDGRVWTFAKIGPRRTQTLRGGIADTAPFHWDGDMKDLRHLMSQVFSTRMGGPPVPDEHVASLGTWMNRLPAVPAGEARDSAAVGRGKTLFQDAKVACATCHSGPLFTNNQTVAVGTGKVFQVPPLKGIGGRAPFMHNGCASTLTARFDPLCGGGDQHGVTSHLSPVQIADLVAYLESI